MESAILREKQIKAGSRARKLALIETLNPDWRDLYEEIVWAVVMGMKGPDCSVTFLDCHVAYATRKDGTLPPDKAVAIQQQRWQNAQNCQFSSLWWWLYWISWVATSACGFLVMTAFLSSSRGAT